MKTRHLNCVDLIIIIIIIIISSSSNLSDCWRIAHCRHGRSTGGIGNCIFGMSAFSQSPCK